MTIGFISHGKCPRCGDELRDCTCPDPCEVCGATDEDTFECSVCGYTGFLCNDCEDAHGETPRHRALEMLANFDARCIEIVVMRKEADAEFANGLLNAYDDVQEAEFALAETVYEWADMVRELLKTGE